VLAENTSNDARTVVSISRDRLALQLGSMLHAPAVTPAPHQLTRTRFRILRQQCCQMSDGIRCSFMSAGSLEAWTLPAL